MVTIPPERRRSVLTDEDIARIADALQHHKCRLPEITADDVRELKNLLELFDGVKQTVTRALTALVLAIIAAIAWLTFDHGIWKK